MTASTVHVASLAPGSALPLVGRAVYTPADDSRGAARVTNLTPGSGVE
jgi:hypothetical protein